jgi:hypothetical protein
LEFRVEGETFEGCCDQTSLRVGTSSLVSYLNGY